MDSTVNQRFKKIRLSLVLSQAQFAEKLSISQASLSDIERGRTELSNNILIVLSNEYGISIDWIITGKGDMKATISDNTAKYDNYRLDETSLVNEINSNKRKVHLYFQRILDTQELYSFVLDIKNSDYAQKEEIMTREVLKEEYLIDNGIEYYDTLNYNDKVLYNEELKRVIEYLLDSFFTKFRYIYVKITNSKVFEGMKKNINKSF